MWQVECNYLALCIITFISILGLVYVDLCDLFGGEIDIFDNSCKLSDYLLAVSIHGFVLLVWWSSFFVFKRLGS